MPINDDIKTTDEFITDGEKHACEKQLDSIDSVVRNGSKAGELLEFPLGVKWRFRWCPPGEFLMGSPSDEPDRKDDETQHRVRLTRGFWMGETAVTQEQWEAVIGSNPSYVECETLPVEQVSWDDCQEFIEKINTLAAGLAPQGFKFALPTEAQWEYACRAGTITAAVGSYPVNAWGLYNMHSNIWEWCSDWYGGYPVGSVTDPTGAKSGSFRVIRGWGWVNFAQYCRSAYRDGYVPSGQGNNLGFRLSLVSDGK